MDSNIVVAIITSVCTAGSTSGVAITALILSNKRMDLLDKRMERIEAALEMLTGSLHDIDKRLFIIEDRILRSGN